MNLAEQYYLISLLEDKGVPVPPAIPKMRKRLNEAIYKDLEVRKRIELIGKSAKVIDKTPTNDPLLDFALGRLNAGYQDLEIPEITQKVVQHLQETGIIAPKQGTIMGFIPSKKVSIENRAILDGLKDRIRSVVYKGGNASKEIIALSELINHRFLLANVFPKNDLAMAEKILKALIIQNEYKEDITYKKEKYKGLKAIPEPSKKIGDNGENLSRKAQEVELEKNIGELKAELEKTRYDLVQCMNDMQIQNLNALKAQNQTIGLILGNIEKDGLTQTNILELLAGEYFKEKCGFSIIFNDIYEKNDAFIVEDDFNIVVQINPSFNTFGNVKRVLVNFQPKQSYMDGDLIHWEKVDDFYGISIDKRYENPRDVMKINLFPPEDEAIFRIIIIANITYANSVFPFHLEESFLIKRGSIKKEKVKSITRKVLSYILKGKDVFGIVG
ncbi:MAG: GPP34 family phosphoprotein [Candidatus Hodarchaeota archaeon]